MLLMFENDAGCVAQVYDNMPSGIVALKDIPDVKIVTVRVVGASGSVLSIERFYSMAEAVRYLARSERGPWTLARENGEVGGEHGGSGKGGRS